MPHWGDGRLLEPGRTAGAGRPDRTAGPPGPAGADGSPIWAIVDSTYDSSGVAVYFVHQSHAADVQLVNGVTVVTFDRDVHACAYQVTSQSGHLSTTAHSVGANQVQVDLFDNDIHQEVLRAYSLTVSC